MSDELRIPRDFFLSRGLFLRALGVIHLIAFGSLWPQIEGLVGENGILPLANYLERAAEALERPILQAPTIFWINSSDVMLNIVCAAGVLAAVLLVAGVLPLLMLALLWILYLSLSVAGQVFLGFQWDVLLLETTFCALFYAPPSLLLNRSWRWQPPKFARWLLWFLLFKLMFLSGATKLLSGDETWRDLTAMNFHYQTQPIPNFLSWHLHHLPEFWHKGEVLWTFAAELIIPFLIFTPRLARHIGCIIMILLQLSIEATGNFGFFNLLTIVLCLPLLDDAFLYRCSPTRSKELVQREENQPRDRQEEERKSAAAIEAMHAPTEAPSILRKASAAALTAVIAVCGFISLITFIEEMVRTQKPTKLPDWVSRPLDLADKRLLSWSAKPINKHFGPFRTFNGYGLFRVMTTERPEIVIEGSNDGSAWKEYEFKWKAGDLDRAPGIVAPHMPRLDWQMWFAALNPNGSQYWLSSLITRLLQGQDEVLALLDENPFPDSPPKFIRLIYYRYEFSDPETRAETGEWWTRTRLAVLTNPVSL